MENLLFVLLMGPTQEDQNPLMSLLRLILIVVVFYFFMIRPQMKKQKEIKKFREDLKSGDKIITTGGIYGKVAEIKENVVIIEVEGKMRLKLDKSAIVRDSSEIGDKK